MYLVKHINFLLDFWRKPHLYHLCHLTSRLHPHPLPLQTGLVLIDNNYECLSVWCMQMHWINDNWPESVPVLGWHQSININFHKPEYICSTIRRLVSSHEVRFCKHQQSVNCQHVIKWEYEFRQSRKGEEEKTG